MTNQNLNPKQFVPNKIVRAVVKKITTPPKITMWGVQKLANVMGHLGVHPLLPENIERRQQAIQHQQDMYLNFLNKMKEANGDGTNFGEKSFGEINGKNNNG